MTDRETVRIYYDGACPFCSNYVSLVRLRRNFSVEFIDARASPEVVECFARRGFDLSEGMIVEFPGSVHFGADAIHALSIASSSEGALNQLLASVFKHRRLSRFLYPAMKVGRRATLALLGKTTKFQAMRDRP